VAEHPEAMGASPQRKPGGMRIRYKLLLTYSALFLLVALASNAFVYWLVQRTVRSNIESQLSTTNETIANMVRTAAQLSVRNRLRAIAEKNQEIARHFYLRAKNGEISDAEARRRAQEVMLSQSIGSTGYLYVLDDNGVIVMHPKQALVGQNLSSYAFIREQLARKSGYLEYQWKNPGEQEERPKALYMVPFEPWGWIISASCYRDEFRQLVHVEDFREHIQSVRFGATGYPYVLDDAGNVVIHPALSGNLIDATDSNGRHFVREMVARRSGSIVYSWQNPGETRFRTKLALFTYLPEYHWLVVSASYEEEFYAPLRAMRNVFIASTLGTLLLLVPLSIVISLSITRPLDHLMAQLRLAAEGDLSVRATVTAHDEVGRLAELFNVLMAKLQAQEVERARMEADKERYLERLRQSEKLEAVGQLAGGIAHDFNNMLTAIMGHSELIRMGSLSSSQRNSVDQILLTTSRATSLTRSLLDFSRKSTTRPDIVDAHQLLSEVTNLVAHTMDKSISIVTELGAPASRLLVDPGLLQNAVLNLILNARDAMPKGGRIRIATSVCTGRELPNVQAPSPEAAYLRVSVVDQGVGMDAETAARAFEPFFTTKEQGKGTGLGLASVYGCVKAHAGDIRLTSSPGAGTTVDIYLPLLADSHVSPTPAPDQELPSGTGCILLVEDEAAVRGFTQDALDGLGYTTIACENGERALAYFSEHHHEIALVLLDLVMPGMGGREVFARMHALDAGVPVLLCSGFTERGDMRGDLPREVAGFLPKPFRIGDLANAVSQAMLHRRPGSSN
jgi:signal transduction histidine kinase/ActR/RegA family two-component response regulator